MKSSEYDEVEIYQFNDSRHDWCAPIDPWLFSPLNYREKLSKKLEGGGHSHTKQYAVNLCPSLVDNGSLSWKIVIDKWRVIMSEIESEIKFKLIDAFELWAMAFIRLKIFLGCRNFLAIKAIFDIFFNSNQQIFLYCVMCENFQQNCKEFYQTITKYSFTAV